MTQKHFFNTKLRLWAYVISKGLERVGDGKSFKGIHRNDTNLAKIAC